MLMVPWFDSSVLRSVFRANLALLIVLRIKWFLKQCEQLSGACHRNRLTEDLHLACNHICALHTTGQYSLALYIFAAFGLPLYCCIRTPCND